jgi:hypothetical protein
MHHYRRYATAAFAAVALTCAQAQQHHFAVEDSIAMQRFTDPNLDQGEHVTSVSPDGRAFAVVTSRGLLKEDRIESTIWLFDVGSVRKLALKPTASTSAEPQVLARFKGVNSTEQESMATAIRSLRWSNDSRSLLFLGRENTSEWHLYRASIGEKQIDRLTPLGQDVAEFDFVADRFAYAVALPCPLYPVPRAVVGTGMPLHSLMDVKRRSTCPNSNELWVSGAKGHVRPVIDPITRETERINTHYGNTLLALSPNGRLVIIAHAVMEVPKAWEQYESGAGTGRIEALSAERLKLAYDIDVPEEVVLVDLDTGVNSIPVDAPLGRDVQYIGPTEVSWSPDGNFVLLTNLMLPLEGPEAEKSERLSAAYIVLLGPKTHSWTPIARLKQYGAKDLHSWWPEKILTDWFHGDVTIQYRENGPAPETYEIAKDHWIQTATPSNIDANPIEVVVRQDLNTPPALFVKLMGLNGSTGYAQIWNPNPQLKDMQFGHAESYSWKDAFGREIHGVLIKPADFQASRRYPLVIEARSYRQDRFVLDGTYATAVAAQTMVGSGLMVLQAGEPSVERGESFRKGTAAALEGYQAVIAKLVGEGLVDSKRVGIIGFSRTCDNVMYAVTHEPGLFAAATIANGFTYGVMGYLEMVDATTDNAPMKQWWLHYGGNPLGDALGTYKRENMLFNLHRVTAPVRVETHDPSYILTDWEAYAGLRSLNKPVDLIVLPYSTHVVSMPADVYESQQGDVDWFRFWLQGYEDPDPAKAEQYKRWEHLRELRDADTKTAASQSQTVPER